MNKDRKLKERKTTRQTEKKKNLRLKPENNEKRKKQGRDRGKY